MLKIRYQTKHYLSTKSKKKNNAHAITLPFAVRADDVTLLQQYEHYLAALYAYATS